MNDDFEHYVEQIFRLLAAAGARATRCRSYWRRSGAGVGNVSPRDIFRRRFQGARLELTRPEDYVNHSLYFEAKTFLHGLLVVEDKLSMAHGLEDPRAVPRQRPCRLRDAAAGQREARQPDRGHAHQRERAGGKAERYFEQTSDGKLILRKMMSRYIPEMIAGREKQGFSAPDASWFKGESIDYVRRRLMNGHAAIYNYLDAKAVRGMIRLRGRPPAARRRGAPYCCQQVLHRGRLPGIRPAEQPVAPHHAELLRRTPSRGVLMSKRIALIACLIGVLATLLPAGEAQATTWPVKISKIHFAQVGNNLNTEYIVFKNRSSAAVKLQGWRRSRAELRQPALLLPPAPGSSAGAKLTLYTGKGTNGPGKRYWGATSPRWDNAGDKAILLSATGATVDTCQYAGGGTTAYC